MLIFPSKIKLSFAVDFSGNTRSGLSQTPLGGCAWSRCGVKLAGVEPAGKLGKVNIECEKLGVFKLSMCSVCVCTDMCSYLKPTDNLTCLPAESRAVLRAGWLLCLFCGSGYFFPADCQQSVHPGMLWRFKGSSRSLKRQHQLLPSLFLGGKQQELS